MDRYQDRYQAGKMLAKALKAYTDNQEVIVLALPRGGVPVAAMVADALHAPLDLMIVRKLGVPGHEELAFGALAGNGVIVYNQDILDGLALSQSKIDQVIAKEEQELKRRNKAYRGDKPFPNLENKIIILIDDGIATGASIKAAILALRHAKPQKIVVAVPVAPADINETMNELADDYVCLMTPCPFSAVGLWYEDFSQTEDEEVMSLLQGIA